MSRPVVEIDVSCLSPLTSHDLLPSEVSKDGDDDVEAVEAGFKWDIFVEVEGAGYDVDHNPDEPLL